MHDNLIVDSMAKKPFKYRAFFVLSFILFSLFICILIFVLGYYNLNKYVHKEIQNSANEEFISKTKNITNYLNLYKEHLSSLNNDKTLTTYLNNPNQTNKQHFINLLSYIIKSDSNIMQLRFLDINGFEKIKFVRENIGLPVYMIQDEHLQNKSNKEYFSIPLKQAKKSIWISDIDLNMENGRIETPLKPTIRLSIPIFQDNQIKGIVVFNLFIKKLLNNLKESSLFDISLIDKDGNFLVGKHIIDGKIIDLSWSKQLDKKINLTKYLQKDVENILESDKYSNEMIFSKNISKELNLNQNLILLLKVKENKINELKADEFNLLITTLVVILILSSIVGMILSYFPNKLAKRLYESNKELDKTKLIFDEYLDGMNINNIITKSNLKGVITYVNDNFCKVSGYSREEAIGKPHSIVRDPDTPKSVFKELWETIQAKKVWKGILRNKRKDGTFYHVDLAIMPILDTNGDIIEYIAIRHNITDLINQKQELFEIATKDSLTSYSNRAKLVSDIEQNEKNNLAVIDIDHFSSINDFYGHTIGDVVLRLFANLISNSLTQEFELYRLHADKFAVLNTSLDKEEFLNFIVKLNQKMIDAVIDLEIVNYDIITTVGISFESNQELILTAEIANKHAKKLHKHFLVYSKSLDIERKFEDNLTWIQKIKSAIYDNRILVMYQPIYNNKTNKIEKYESLVRLQDENGDIISPFFFLDNAKQSKQYITITKKVIDASFNKFKNNNYEFSINLTLEDILDKELVNYLEDKIIEYDIGKRVVLELVESEGVEEFSIIEKQIDRLKNYGCKLAIDDFGTGYSNFEYLLKIQADYVKIDGSMIKEINVNQNTRDIVKTIIDFTKKMNLKTIAEYVSSKEILDVVKDLDIDYSQGYYIGKPEFELLEDIEV